MYRLAIDSPLLAETNLEMADVYSTTGTVVLRVTHKKVVPNVVAITEQHIFN